MSPTTRREFVKGAVAAGVVIGFGRRAESYVVVVAPSGGGGDGSQAWSYIGIPYPTDNVPSAIMPTLPTGADRAGWPYDPCTIAKPTVGDVADWDNAPNAYYVAYDGDNGTAGNGGNGNPTNPRLTLPSGSLPAGTIIFVEGEGIARPSGDGSVTTGRDFHEITGWEPTPATFNSAGTYSTTDDICWMVGINDPRIQAADGTLQNSNHFIFDGVIFGHPSDNRAGRIIMSNCHYSCFRHGAQYGNGTGFENNVGGQELGISDCTFHMYYDQEIAYCGAWLETVSVKDFHAWRPSWDNRWLWCIDCHLHHLAGDSTQVGNSDNLDTIDHNSHYTYFAGNECHDNQENAIDCKNSSHVICSGNHCYDFTGAGAGGANSTAIVLSQDGEGYHSNHHWAFANLVHDSGLGIRCSGNNGAGDDGPTSTPNSDGFIQADRDYVIGNLIYDCTTGMSAAHGSDQDTGGAEHHFINNTVARATTGVDINMFQGSNPLFDNYIDGNIFYECTTEISVSGDNALDHYEVTDNVLFKTGGGEVIEGTPDVQSGNILGQDPLFVDPANNDFDLASTSSSAHDMTDENAAYQLFQDMYGIDIRKDFAERTRPAGAAWDAGAYEFQ